MIDKTPAWSQLRQLAQQAPRIETLFEQDAGRFAAFSRGIDGLLLDISKTALTADALQALLQLAQDAGLPQRIAAMFRGDAINTSENRAVEHAASRAGDDMPADMQDTLARMRAFAADVREGRHKGHSGRRIRHVVNIGIGGSHMGPQLAALAMAGTDEPVTAHFVSNVEGSDLARTLAPLDLGETLFIVASKSFSTPETMLNARIARERLIAHYNGDEAAVPAHFVALSTQAERVGAFGIAPGQMYPFRDSIGGRFSAWSAIGLSVMLAAGVAAFDQWHAGARAMDAHFRDTPLAGNLPVLLALCGIWHRNFRAHPALAVIPYHSRLARLPAWLQQLDMESNGKAVTQAGETVTYATGPAIFGEPGTDAQHSFFQWLHQSPDVTPVEFIGVCKAEAGTRAQHDMLTANLLAQSESLMRGSASPDALYKNFTGNRPSVTILLDAMAPYHLGLLMALYEHKVFAQGVIWGINSFDQFGVELGKIMAADLEKEIAAKTPGAHDASTVGLMRHILNQQKS